MLCYYRSLLFVRAPCSVFEGPRTKPRALENADRDFHDAQQKRSIDCVVIFYRA